MTSCELVIADYLNALKADIVNLRSDRIFSLWKVRR